MQIKNLQIKNKNIINDHTFIDIEGGGKGGRPRMTGPTRTRSTMVEEK